MDIFSIYYGDWTEGSNRYLCHENKTSEEFKNDFSEELMNASKKLTIDEAYITYYNLIAEVCVLLYENRGYFPLKVKDSISLDSDNIINRDKVKNDIRSKLSDIPGIDACLESIVQHNKKIDRSIGYEE